jgi:hypothetical protein
MNSEPHNQDHNSPSNGLDRRLRQAVEKVRHNGVPEDSMRDVLDRLRRQGPPVVQPRKPIRYRVAWAFALTATASIVIALLLHQFDINGLRQPEIARDTKPSPAVTTDNSLEPHETIEETEQNPTFWTYRQAACRSPEALDVLLDEHSQQTAFVKPTVLIF